MRQRGVEIGLLRTIGGTPRQARRLVRAEALLVVRGRRRRPAPCSPPWAAGSCFTALRDGGMVADDVAFGGGPVSLGVTALAWSRPACSRPRIAGRRATRGPATLALARGRAPSRPDAAGGGSPSRCCCSATASRMARRHHHRDRTTPPTRTTRWRPPAPARSWSASAWPSSRRCCCAGRPRWRSPPSAGRARRGHLAAYNTSRRAHLLGGVLAPVIVLHRGVGVGTLMLVGIDDRTLGRCRDRGHRDHQPAQQRGRRDDLAVRRDHGAQRLRGRRRPPARRARAAAAARRHPDPGRAARSSPRPRSSPAIGVVLGLIASLATIVPFAVARDEGIVPDGQLWLPRR